MKIKNVCDFFCNKKRRLLPPFSSSLEIDVIFVFVGKNLCGNSADNCIFGYVLDNESACAYKSIGMDRYATKGYCAASNRDVVFKDRGFSVFVSDSDLLIYSAVFANFLRAYDGGESVLNVQAAADLIRINIQAFKGLPKDSCNK